MSPSNAMDQTNQDPALQIDGKPIEPIKLSTRSPLVTMTKIPTGKEIAIINNRGKISPLDANLGEEIIG